tara:strand:+ start:1119 stop:2105 length:987 start_codon:yes stop_codon:yes gene_type:complete
MSNFNWNSVLNIKESFSQNIKTQNIKTQNIKKKNKCVGCESSDLEKQNDGNMVCCNCGAINGMTLNYEKEWRYYGANDNMNKSDPNRCGIPLNPLFNESSLSVAIIGNKCFKFKNMNNWNGMTYKERKTIKILNKIKKIARDNHIPQKVVDQSIVIFNENSKEKIKRGKKLECILGSCFRLALKYYSNDDKNVNRSMEELSAIFGLKEKKLSKEYNELYENMYKSNPKFTKKIKPTKPKDLIHRYCLLLGINEKYSNICIETIKNTDELGICQDNNPKSIAVGCIYLICVHYNLDINKKKISQICKTSEVTILLIYNQLNIYKKYILT